MCILIDLIKFKFTLWGIENQWNKKHATGKGFLFYIEPLWLLSQGNFELFTHAWHKAD